MKNYQMLIDGKSVDALSRQTFEVENPATGECIATVPFGRSEDVDLAVAAARRAFEQGSWRNLQPKERGQFLWKLADALQARTEEFAILETLDSGMPLWRSRHSVGRGLDAIRFYAGMCTKIYGRTAEPSVGDGLEYLAYTTREPVGVAGLIVPWNGPLLVVCNKMAPALAAGCSVIVKPAEQTPLTAIRFAELVLETGIPPGVFNVVTGLGPEAGTALTAHDDVDKISFTGSTSVGKQIVRAAAGNLKRLSLELGGKSPVFVFDDADEDIMLAGCAKAIFNNTGQTCVAGSRLYVQKKSYDRVVSGLVDIARKYRLGDGMKPDTELGPVVSALQEKRILEYIRLGTEEGAELVAGGRKSGEQGYFIEPTIFAATKPHMRIVTEEIFGPVLGISVFEDISEVAAIANSTPYGLAAGVFTTDMSTAHRVAKMIRSGNVWLNCYGLMDYSMPFGGFKQSGWGRENGPEGIEAFLETKSVYARL